MDTQKEEMNERKQEAGRVGNQASSAKGEANPRPYNYAVLCRTQEERSPARQRRNE